jgi:hypothetical protein
MLGQILILLCWGAAGGVAWWWRGTIGSEIKKKNPTLYDSLKNDPENAIKNELVAVEKDKKTNEELRDKNQKSINPEEEDALKEGSEEYKTASQNIQQANKDIGKSEAKIKQLNTIKEKGLDAFDWGWKNIAWTGGIFLGIGLILHLIVKKVMKIFKDE